MDVIDAFWEIDFGRSVHWRVPFMALDGTPYQIDIYEPNYSGSVVVLKGGAQPFVTQETDDEDAFLPIRSSSGYITVICESQSLVDAILPVNVHDRYVELVDVTPNANKVVWNGYILPEEYSGDWNVTPFELQLPIASPIAACLDLQYSGFFKAVTIGEVLKKILYNQLKVAPTYIYSGKFPNQTASMLTAVFSDIQFAEVDTDPQSPAYGTGQSVGFGDDYSTIGDVLEAFCKLYGYVIHETPDALWFCSSDMSLTYFKTTMEYNPTMSYVTSETTETLTDVDLPDVVSAYNSRSLLPGKSKVRVYCEAEEVKEVIECDISKLEPISVFSQDGNQLNGNVSFRSATRGNNALNLCFQWDLDNQFVFGEPNIYKSNYEAEDREIWGANFLSVVTWKSPDYVFATEFDKFKDYVYMYSSPGDQQTAPVRRCVAFISEKEYSAVNFTRNGIILNMKCQASKDIRGWNEKWKYTGYLRITVRWGDYYLAKHSEGLIPYDVYEWIPANTIDSSNIGTVMHAVKMGSRNDSDPEGISTPLTYVQTRIVDWDRYALDYMEGYSMQVPTEGAELVNGQIQIDIYNFYEYNGIKYLLLSDITLEHEGFKLLSLCDPTDHYLSDYRQLLSNSKNEEYEYEQTLNNLMRSYSPSGVKQPAIVQEETEEPSLEDVVAAMIASNENFNTNLLFTVPQSYYAETPSEYYEQTVLSRLANWFNRTIEQLNITVERTALTPGQRIEYNDGLYIVVSRADNWRDSNVTLTLQKLYEATN